MPDAPDPITSPPAQAFQPYDATSDADSGPWVKISANLPGGSEDLFRTDFEDGPGPWRQA